MDGLDTPEKISELEVAAEDVMEEERKNLKIPKRSDWINETRSRKSRTRRFWHK